MHSDQRLPSQAGCTKEYGAQDIHVDKDRGEWAPTRVERSEATWRDPCTYCILSGSVNWVTRKVEGSE